MFKVNQECLLSQGKKNKIIKQKCKKHLIVVKVVKQSLYFIIDLGSEKVKSLRAKGS